MPKLRILLDECLDRRLAKIISHHTVKTVPQAGWSGLTNGELLNKAQKTFDIFITHDKNLSSQQNLQKYNIAILVLCPASSRLQDLQKTLQRAIKKLNALEIGYATFVE